MVSAVLRKLPLPPALGIGGWSVETVTFWGDRPRSVMRDTPTPLSQPPN